MDVRRRWLRFSLRGFLALMALACLWLGRASYQVRERERILATLVAPDHVEYGESIADEYRQRGSEPPSWAADLRALPISLRLLGARPVRRIRVEFGVYLQHHHDIQRLFPEAVVSDYFVFGGIEVAR